MRLAGSGVAYAGRVEVFLNGSWGTICDDSWSFQDGNVVCRQLGFPGAMVTTQQAAFGEGTGPIHLDELDCGGDEASILECSHDGVGNHDCGHWEDAGVICMPHEAEGKR